MKPVYVFDTVGNAAGGLWPEGKIRPAKYRTMKRLTVLLVLVFVNASCGRYLAETVESPLVDRGEVTFRVKKPSARTVQVGGDWPGNNWAEGDAEGGEVLVGLMELDEKNGVWETTVTLKPGRYRYKFLVNETSWVLDPGNSRVVDDGRGGKANLLIILP